MWLRNGGIIHVLLLLCVSAPAENSIIKIFSYNATTLVSLLVDLVVLPGYLNHLLTCVSLSPPPSCVFKPSLLSFFFLYVLCEWKSELIFATLRPPHEQQARVDVLNPCLTTEALKTVRFTRPFRAPVGQAEGGWRRGYDSDSRPLRVEYLSV